MLKTNNKKFAKFGKQNLFLITLFKYNSKQIVITMLQFLSLINITQQNSAL